MKAFYEKILREQRMLTNKWKNIITQGIKECICRQIDQQRNESEKYTATDTIVVSQKRYMRLERKAAAAELD